MASKNKGKREKKKARHEKSAHGNKRSFVEGGPFPRFEAILDKELAKNKENAKAKYKR